MASKDFASAEEFLKAAAYLVVPEDQTQRQAFEKLMPHLFVLRNKGCSFVQLAGLLTQCGLNLQPSGVRRYFEEMLVDRMDACQAQMNEQIKVLAEVRKETKDVDLSAIAGKVDAVMSQRRADASAKLDQVLNRGIPPTAYKKSADRKDAAPSTRVEAPNALRLHPQASTETQAVALHPLPAVSKPAAPTPYRVQVVQQVEPPPTHAEQEAPAPRLCCGEPKQGITALKKRDDLAAIYYENVELEHPAIPHLLLSLEQRCYGTFLEITNLNDGEIRLETFKEKRFRVIWQKPVPMTQTRTGDSFVKMDMSNFKNP